MSDGCGTVGCSGCLGLEGHASNCPAAKRHAITVGGDVIGYIKKLEPHEQSSLVGTVDPPTSGSLPPDWYFTDRTYGDLVTRDVGSNTTTTITTFTVAEVAVLRVLIQSYAQAEREDVIGLILKMTGKTILPTGEDIVALAKKLGG